MQIRYYKMIFKFNSKFEEMFVQYSTSARSKWKSKIFSRGFVALTWKLKVRFWWCVWFKFIEIGYLKKILPDRNLRTNECNSAKYKFAVLQCNRQRKLCHLCQKILILVKLTMFSMVRFTKRHEEKFSQVN